MKPVYRYRSSKESYMKKHKKPKLALAKETLRALENRNLSGALGGWGSIVVCGETNMAGCTQTECGPCPNIDSTNPMVC